MLIEKVTIRGFQSHVDSTFTFAPGLTVITGPSDAGKTAIIRALRWLAFNEPQGEAFLYTVRNPDGSVKAAVDQASVEVTFNSGITMSKIRRKGKTTYIHSAYAESWEKAEVPPEIKETLGLVKVAYGENFEACLNFAFQLDPPFLLSETGGTSAKVLGKLAGTEVVDKSIGEVNKRTHKSRTELAQAEKMIGQLDVELLEYLTLEERWTAFVQAEDKFQSVEKWLDLQKELRNQLVGYEQVTKDKISYFDMLEPLKHIPLIKINLQTVEYNEGKYQVIKDLDADFWKSVNQVKDNNSLLKKLERVEEVKDLLTAVKSNDTRCDTLVLSHKSHALIMTNKRLLEEEIGSLVNLLKSKRQLFTVTGNKKRLDQLEYLVRMQKQATEGCNSLLGILDTLKEISTQKAKLQDLQGKTSILTALQALQSALYVRIADTDTEKAKLSFATRTVEQAQIELKEAWEAAGGICPLCEQTIERRGNKCIN